MIRRVLRGYDRGWKCMFKFILKRLVQPGWGILETEFWMDRMLMEGGKVKNG